MASSSGTLGSSPVQSSLPSKQSSGMHGFFANTPGDSLEEKALHALFNQFDFNVAKLLAFLSSAKNKELELYLNLRIPHIKRLLFRVNTLCTYIANAEKKELRDFLDANTKLLPLLLKLKTTVRSCRGHLYENCNTIQIAIKAGDVGRKGCELHLVSDEEPANTTQEKLFLYSDADANAPLRYIVNGTEHTIQRGEGVDQLNPDYFNTLKAMFRNGLMNKPLYLSTDNLTDAELNAYSALLKITKARGHTTFVKEDGIIEFLKEKYFKNNEAEFDKLSQFPEETLAQAEIRRNQDKAALENVFKAIAQSNCDADCAAAITNFKEYLKARLACPATTFDVDINLFLTASTMEDHYVKNVDNFGNYYGRKSDLVFNEVIGPIENILSICSQMAIAQGISYQEDGEAFRRALKLRWCDSSIADFLSSGSGWVDDSAWAATLAAVARCAGARALFLNFFRQKQVMCGVIQRCEQPLRQPEPMNHRKRCVIL